MEYDHSLFQENVGYYRNRGIWLPGKRIKNGRLTWTEKAVDAALNMDLNDSDVLFATYPKTGKALFTRNVCICINVKLCHTS